MFKRTLAVLLTLLMVFGIMPSNIFANDDIATISEPTVVKSGTWGGIDWTLTEDGTLTISPTVNEIKKTKPYSETNPKELYQVGEIPAAVNDDISDITGWPFAPKQNGKRNPADIEAIKRLVIEEGVTSIGSFALQGLTSVTGEVVIPSTVTYIGQEAFQKTSMTKLTFAKGGTKELCIGPGAFKSLAITDLVLPEDRSSIHIHCWAFNGCSKLENITIPANVDFSSRDYWGWVHAEYNGMNNFHPNNSYAWSSDIFASCPKIKTITFGSEEVKNNFFGIQGNKATINALPGVVTEVKAPSVAQIGEQGYETLAKALEKANAGDTITLLADIAEDVTISKAVTIDGNDKTMGGTVTLATPNTGTTVFKNVVFKTAKTNSIITTANSYNVTFDACTFNGASSYSFEIPAGSTANNFKFINECKVDMTSSLMQISGSASDMLVDGMHIINCSNAFKVNKCGNAITFNEVTVDNAYIFIYGMGYADMSFNINDCDITATFPFVRQDRAVITYTYTFTGENEIVAKADDSTAPVSATQYDGLYIVNGFDMGSQVIWNAKQPSGYVAYRADVTDKTDREGIAILLKEVYAKNSVVVKVYNNDTLMFTSTRRDIDDEGKVMFPVDGNTTANIVLWGKESGSWINEILVAPTELNVPNKIEVYADDVLVDTYTNSTGTILGDQLDKYLALDCVQKATVQIGETKYLTLAEAIKKAIAGDEIVLLDNVAVSDLTIEKDIKLNLNGFKLSLTPSAYGGFAINLKSELTITGDGDVVVAPQTPPGRPLGFGISIGESGKLIIEGGNYSVASGAIGNIGSVIGELVINGGSFTGATNTSLFNTDSNAEIAITGGTFSHVPFQERENDTRDIAISGGSFGKEVPEEFCAEGYIPTKNSEGNYTVKVGSYKASVNGVKYESLTEAITKATAGDTITFLANITEDVTINKNLTIDGAGKTYTGTMTLSKGFDVSVKNVNFDGANGTLPYAFKSEGANSLTVNKCEAKNYQYSFLYVRSAMGTVSVKDVTVENCPNYAVYFASGVNTATFENFTVKNSNNGFIINNTADRILTIKNCIMENVVTAINHTGGTNTITCTVLGDKNNFGSATISKYANVVLGEATATLTAPAGLNITTSVAEKDVLYKDGKYYIGKAVAKVNGVGYGTLSEAIANATAGDTVIFLDNITEDVTINKNLTINGAGKTYTGKMILKDGNIAIKNINFDGKGYNGYALEGQGADYITVEGCTLQNYGYGLLQVSSAAAIVNVKKVTVSNADYGVKIDYAGAVNIEEVDFDCAVAALLNSNYGKKTITIKDSKLSILGTWKRDGYDEKNQTFKFVGANTVESFVIVDSVDNLVLVNGATLTAPEGKTVLPTDETYFVEYDKVAKAYVTVDAVATATVGGVTTYYKTVEEAINYVDDKIYGNEATEGTVTLLKDVEVRYLSVYEGITLDLNGNKLTVKRSMVGYKTSNVIDSSEAKTGAIVIKKGSLELDKANAQLPIYDSANGCYKLIKVSLTSKSGNLRYSYDEETGKFSMSPLFGESVDVRLIANELISCGYEVSGLKVVVRLTWSKDGEYYATQDYAYQDKFVQKVIDSFGINPETGNYAYLDMFTATFEGDDITSATDVKVNAVIVTDSGAELPGANEISIKVVNTTNE